MRVVPIPIDDPQWREFTTSHPDASPFHLPAWAVLIADCYRFEAFVLAVRDTDDEILAGVPTVAVRSPLGKKRWVSLPYSDFCPLLARPDVPIDDLVAAVKEHVLGSPVRELEVRTSLPAGDGVFPLEVGYTYLLDLPRDPADLHPSKGHRQHRNKAVRNGVEVTRGRGRSEVDTFYRLHTLTRRRQGVPVQPRRFMDLIRERLLERGHGFVATATIEGEPVASNLYLTHNGTLMAKFRASDPARQDSGAGFLVDWEMIAAGCAEGYHTLDLGRTDFGAEGQRRYKSGWGAPETSLVYTHFAEQAPSPERLHVDGLPQKIIQSSPPWVCRALGEALYRWSA